MVYLGHPIVHKIIIITIWFFTYKIAIIDITSCVASYSTDSLQVKKCVLLHLVLFTSHPFKVNETIDIPSYEDGNDEGLNTNKQAEVIKVELLAAWNRKA